MAGVAQQTPPAPSDQRGSGGRSNNAQRFISSASRRIRPITGCQPAKSALACSGSPRWLQPSSCQPRLLNDADEVHQPARPDIGRDRMPSATGPDTPRFRRLNTAKPLDRNQRPPRNVPGEPWGFGPQHLRPDRRANAVGTNKDIRRVAVTLLRHRNDLTIGLTISRDLYAGLNAIRLQTRPDACAAHPPDRPGAPGNSRHPTARARSGRIGIEKHLPPAAAQAQIDRFRLEQNGCKILQHPQRIQNPGPVSG